MIASSTPSGRIAGLDSLRGIAAFGVLLLHYEAHFHAAPFRRLFAPFYSGGGYLVDVFFVLSGVLLGSLYKDSRDCGAFLIKRIFRLFPLHWVTLCSVALLQWLYFADAGTFFVYEANSPWLFLLNLGLLQNFGLERPIAFSFNGPAWSISVEWATNLVLAVLLFLPKLRVWLAAALAVGAMACLWAVNGRLSGFGIVGVWPLELTTPMLRGFFGFFAGVALVSVLPVGGQPRRVADAVGVIGATAIVCVLSHPAWLTNPWAEFFLVGVLTPAVIFSCSRGPSLARLSRTPALLILGRLSFSVYLWHFSVQIAFELLRARGWGMNYESPSALLFFLACTYAVAYLSWRYLERPAQRWGTSMADSSASRRGLPDLPQSS